MAAARVTQVPRWRLFAFAAGDFAFNLYWQSAMLYLLFYYTDALGITMATATAIYLAASVWDGAASFAVGAIVDRHGAGQGLRRALLIAAVPLGLSFVLTYLSPPFGGVAFVLGGHLLFRTAYAAANVPYLALSARVSANPRDRALVAGLRMLAGTAAAVIVALGTVPVGGWLMRVPSGADAFFGAALLFAAVASVLLLAVGRTFRDAVQPAPAPRVPIRIALTDVARNRAFVTLAGAMVAMIVAAGTLDKSVLYYFKYVVGDEKAGQLALAQMMAVSAAAVPAWMLVARAIGVRRVWFAAVAIGAAGLAAFALIDLPGAGAAQAFLMLMQGAIVGLHFAFWALLPDTVEWGERTSGRRVEGTVFGLAALLQRFAIGVATAILGLSLGEAGFTANVAQAPAALGAMRLTIALVPLGFLLLSAVLMWLCPLRTRA